MRCEVGLARIWIRAEPLVGPRTLLNRENMVLLNGWKRVNLTQNH